jgi:tyrosyl-tRNA synthetase
VDQGEVDQYKTALEEIDKHMEPGDPLHPMQIKKALGRAIVSEYHNAKAAKQAEENFAKVVQRKELPDEIPVVSFQKKKLPLFEVIAESAGISKGEARRLVHQGGVKLEGEKVSDAAQEIGLGAQAQTLQVGKRRFFQIIFQIKKK